MIASKFKEPGRHIQPPCARCPYKLGQIQTLINPCPQCKAEGYKAFERFLRQAPRTGDRTPQ